MCPGAMIFDNLELLAISCWLLARKPRPTPIWDAPGMTWSKSFEILIGSQGEGWLKIARIAKIG
jgi:hypothetical protein